MKLNSRRHLDAFLGVRRIRRIRAISRSAPTRMKRRLYWAWPILLRSASRTSSSLIKTSRKLSTPKNAMPPGAEGIDK